MSPKQVMPLASHDESERSAHAQRHFEGRPFETDIATMPFYGEPAGEHARSRASAAAKRGSHPVNGKLQPREAVYQADQAAVQQPLSPRAASPLPRKIDTVPSLPAEKASSVPHTVTVERHSIPRETTDSTHIRTAQQEPQQDQLQGADPTAEQLPRASSPLTKRKPRPNALSFLDPDSPAITEASITRAVAEAASWCSVDLGSFSTTATPSSANASVLPLSPPLSTESDQSVRRDDSLPWMQRGAQGTDTDAGTHASEKEDEADAGSPTPQPTPTAGAPLCGPGPSSMGMASDPSTSNHLPPPSQAAMESSLHARPPRPYGQLEAYEPLQQKAHLVAQQRKHRSYRYGTPEMPRGNANLPHLPANALNPRVPATGHVKHLPRAEKLPLTGYELLAAQLSSHSSHVMRFRRGSVGAASTRSSHSTRSPASATDTSSHGCVGAETCPAPREATAGDLPFEVKPLYRKFEALNHRLLLHLQDELSELEEQLHRLDTADTQTRRLQNSILPASRRAEVLAGGELQWHKTDVLGKIGYKLGQYNHVLSSFTETQRLASPALSDIDDYRSYLYTQQPIAEIETRFLDASDDLVTLAVSASKRPSSGMSSNSSSEFEDSFSPAYLHTLAEKARAPVQAGPLFHDLANPPSPSGSSMSESGASSADALASSSCATTVVFDKEHEKESEGTKPHCHEPLHPLANQTTVPTSRNLVHFAIANTVAAAVLVPILAFGFIPSSCGRTAVLLVVCTVFGAQVQAGGIPIARDAVSKRDIGGYMLLCAAVYGAATAVLVHGWV